jgi:hypothetical protein
LIHPFTAANRTSGCSGKKSCARRRSLPRLSSLSGTSGNCSFEIFGNRQHTCQSG